MSLKDLNSYKKHANKKIHTAEQGSPEQQKVPPYKKRKLRDTRK